MIAGLIGGTGPEGRGLALRIALGGMDVVLGSRDPERARQAAGTLSPYIEGRPASGLVRPATNREAAADSDIVILTVPYSGQAPLLRDLAGTLIGKICVNTISPTEMRDDGRLHSVAPPAGSAAEEARNLAPEARWVAGFHTIAARDLLRGTRPLNADALICSDDDGARREVMDLAARFDGLRPVDAGLLDSARILEPIVVLLVSINRRYKAHSSIRIAGI